MKQFEHNYIVPGEIFSDESVLCMRCATPIMRLGYQEMPKINNPKQKVNVACKIRLHNYRIVPVVFLKNGKQMVSFVLLCKDCEKKTTVEKYSDLIVKQLIRANQLESKWAGNSKEVIDAIPTRYVGCKIVRRLTPQEAMENKISEEA